MTGQSAWRQAARRHRSELVMAVGAALTLGLAPYLPHPHVYKQLVNLGRGELRAPIDIFDLALHGIPWIALMIVALRAVRTARALRAAR